KLEMVCGRCRSTNNVRPGFAQGLIQLAKMLLNRKPSSELLRQSRFAVTGANHLTSLDSLDLRGVGVGDFTASYNRYFKHAVFRSGTLRNNSEVHPREKLSASSPTAISVFHCCTGSSSNK